MYTVNYKFLWLEIISFDQTLSYGLLILYSYMFNLIPLLDLAWHLLTAIFIEDLGLLSVFSSLNLLTLNESTLMNQCDAIKIVVHKKAIILTQNNIFYVWHWNSRRGMSNTFKKHMFDRNVSKRKWIDKNWHFQQVYNSVKLEQMMFLLPYILSVYIDSNCA